MLKPKILFLLHLPPPVHGSSMVGKWIKESVLINTSFTASYINLLASKNVSESGKVTVGKLLGMFKVCFKLIIHLIKEKPQQCYLALTTTGAAFYRDALLVAIMRVFSVQRVYHLHNKGVAKATSNKLNKLIYSFVFKNASVVLLSNHLYYDIANFVPKECIHICPNGIPDIAISEEDKLNETHVPIILFLSNLIESKGVFVLLEALSILKQQNKAFKAVFVGGEGDISAMDFNQKIDELNLSKEVKYLGKKYGNEKNTIFKNSDIFAFPTYYSNECFPLVLLEAMQFSLPIISTYEGGVPDLINDNETGFLIPQKNSKILAEKLLILINDANLRIMMGQKGYEKYNSEYTLDIFEKKIVNILNKTKIKC